MNKYFFLLLFFLIAGCAGSGQLKKYRGVEIGVIKKEFGNPTRHIPLSGREIYIYEKTIGLRSTEISKGQATLDPMISPPVIKTERIIFTVKSGFVTDIKRETEYSRK